MSEATGGSLNIANSLIINGSSSGSVTLAATATGSPQYQGTSTNDSAATGGIGEWLTSNVLVGSAVSLSTGTPANITSLSLTAGDWDVTAFPVLTGGATTTVSSMLFALGTTSATINQLAGTFNQSLGFSSTLFAGSGLWTEQIGPIRFSLSTTTTIYLVADVSFGTSTCSGYGLLSARRAR